MSWRNDKLEDQSASVSAVREVVRSLDEGAFVTVAPLEENMRRGLEPARMGAWFSGPVSLLAPAHRGLQLTVEGAPVVLSKTITYKGMM